MVPAHRIAQIGLLAFQPVDVPAMVTAGVNPARVGAKSPLKIDMAVELAVLMTKDIVPPVFVTHAEFLYGVSCVWPATTTAEADVARDTTAPLWTIAGYSNTPVIAYNEL